MGIFNKKDELNSKSNMGLVGKVKFLEVRFLLSPTGLFKLGYHVGDEANIPEPLAMELIETKYAEKV
ncbi:hypothetical protein BTO06_01065 [Tenacibaculum sp. SZ-18]|uniref:hypothetical protein n=1 Tax=Tenacibaculum sp. SZ-18 TaxID=754423 RepID=UPI000C2D1372|nr:hypothetical protein [Tenacibaculum sp. SZ-18]AUC13824.1 hypothetical protein BTO06_01065 [Tenacibaculum sp. SZ-18]